MTTSLSRPDVLLSAAISLDGYLDDTTDERLILSNDIDFDEVKHIRGDFDAIMVGATTIRRDNPSLRAADGPHPRKVTITASGNLDPDCKFFTTGEPPIVFCREPAAKQLQYKLADRADVHSLPAGAGLPEALTMLHRLGIRSLMVEGGGTLHTQFLTECLADELRLAVAPFFVGDADAPRFTGPGKFLHDSRHRMRLDEVEYLGDMVAVRYTLSTEIERTLDTAISSPSQ